MVREYKRQIYFVTIFMMSLLLLWVTGISVQAEEQTGDNPLDNIVQQYLKPELCLSDEYGPDGNRPEACTKEQLKEMTDDLNSYLEKNNITSESKEIDKVKAISMYVADRIYYDDYRAKSEEVSIAEQMVVDSYQVWKQKRSVCQGYAHLLHTLLIANGIPDQDVITMEHMINITYLKDEKRWIYVDTTWMSPHKVIADSATGEEDWCDGGRLVMGWFNINSATMSNEPHHLIYQIKNLVCDGVVYNFLANEIGSNMLESQGKVYNSVEIWNAQKGWNLSVSGAYPKEIEEVNIHAINDIPVKKIFAAAFYKNKSIKTVTLPDTMVSIGERCFYECTALTRINIPRLVTQILNFTFVGCESLETVDIQGANIQFIGYYGFGKCPRLKALDLSNCQLKKLEQYAFVDDKELEEVKLTGADIEEIGLSVFSGCSKLKTLDLADKHIKSIGNYAFQNCTSLTEIDLSGSAVEKLMYTFCGCSGLTTVRFPATLTTLDGSTFYKCTALTALDLSNTALNTMGQSVCSEMSALTKVVVPKTLETIDFRAFYLCNKLETIDLSECNIKKIGEYAFYSCSSLQEIDLDKSTLTTLGKYSFAYCSAVTKFAAPAKLETIDEAAFYGCSSLKEIELAHTALKDIGQTAFYCASELKKISLPNTLKSIGDYAFYVKQSKILRVISEFTKTQLALLGEENTWKNCSLTCAKGFYTLLYDGNGATAGEMDSEEGTIGEEFVLEQNKYQKAGYRFKCWNTSSDGTGTAYEDKAKVPCLATKDKEEVTLYAIWEKEDSAGEAKPGENPGQDTPGGNDPGKEDPGQDTPGDNSAGKDDSGQMTPVTYKITYYVNGGTNSSYNPKTYTTKDADIILCDPVKSGYQFKGWYLEAERITRVTKIETAFAKNICVYAAWECMHKKTTIKNQKAATYTADGYSGDRYCSTCGSLISKGESIPKLKKENPQNSSKKEENPQSPSKKEEKTQTPDDGKNTVKTGDVLTVAGVKYKVTKAGEKGEVAFYGFVNKKATAVTVKSSVKIKGITYKVTSIANKAFYNRTALKKVSISVNVVKIGKAAFEKCKNLKSIIIHTQKLKEKAVGANAFKGTHKNAIVKVPAKSYVTYQKILVKKGISKKAKIRKQ